ncbi:MAG: HEAT repeat domain-containing protein, partial [Burkholderiales bacterium]
ILDVLQALVKLLADEDGEVRRNAAEALGKLGSSLVKLVTNWLETKTEPSGLVSLVPLVITAFLAGNISMQVLWHTQTVVYYWQGFVNQQQFSLPVSLEQARLLRYLVPKILDQFLVNGSVNDKELTQQLTTLPAADKDALNLPEYVAYKEAQTKPQLPVISPTSPIHAPVVALNQQESSNLSDYLVVLQQDGKLELKHDKKEVVITWYTKLDAEKVKKNLLELLEKLESLNSWKKMEDCDRVDNQLTIEFRTTAHAKAFIEEWEAALANTVI